MNKQEETQLFETAIQKWGANAQMDMVVEECAELIKAINKFKRNVSSDTIKELCGEIADVEIMCYQARIMLKKGELIDDIKEQKLERLKSRLNS